MSSTWLSAAVRYVAAVSARGSGLALAASVALSAAGAAPVTVDPALPAYTPVQGVAGNLKSMGSDTMNNLMTHWGEAFNKAYPGVRIEIEGKGSQTAPPALIEGQAQLGAMSREMKPSEVDAFEKAFGHKPTQLRTAIDCLAVYVHKDCPLEEIRLEDVRRVFSVEGPDLTWGDLGVTDPAYKLKPIALYGRNSSSGTYGYFKQVALGDRDFKTSVKEQPGSSAVVQAVATDPFAMGYSGLGYKTQDVKALRVSIEGGVAVEPSADTAYSGEYPLARFLYVYVNHKPGSAMEPLRAEFVRFVFSRDGQETVIKDGYIPVPATIAREELEKVGVKPGF